MELSKQQIKITKGIAILFMLLLHLFCRKTYEGMFVPVLFIEDIPLIYYFALFGDCCVAIYCFCSGYGLFISYEKNQNKYLRNNLIRLLKLYINYWIIVFLFVVVLGFITKKQGVYPIEVKEIILTITAVSPGYNGAWWFLTTYMFLVLLSPIINKIVKKYNYIIIIIVSLILYFIGYLQRIKGLIIVDNSILEWILRQFGLWGTSQFPYVVGAIFAYKKLYSSVYRKVSTLKFKNILSILLILLMILVHGVVETLFIAAFTGVIFIVLFNLIDKPRWMNSLLQYLANHSTNMWLIHMFLYSVYFRSIVFAPKYPILIYIWLVILSLIGSYVVNLFYKPIIYLFNKKSNNEVKKLNI